MAPEDFVAHLARFPRWLDSDMRRIAELEGTTFAELERRFLESMVRMYDAVDVEVVVADRD